MTRRRTRRILTGAPVLDATRTGRGGAVLVLLLAVVGCTVILYQPTSSQEPTPTPVASTTPAATPAVLGGWTKVGVAPVGSVEALVGTADGYLAVGRTELGTPAIWRSANGTTWEAVGGLPPAASVLQRLVRTASGYLALGNTTSVDFGTPVLWTSPDGTAWTDAHLVPSNEAGVAIGVGEWQGRPIVTGSLGSPGEGEGQATVWLPGTDGGWTARGLSGDFAAGAVVVGGRLVVVGTADQPREGRTWTTPDGSQWKAAFVDGMTDAEILDVAMANGLVVAAGATWDDATGIRVPAVWTSTDGITWSLGLAPRCCGLIREVAATADGWLGVGDLDGGAALFSSPDGLRWEVAGTIAGFDGTLSGVADVPGLGPVLLGSDTPGADERAVYLKAPASNGS